MNFVQLFVTPWTTAHQFPLSTGFSRQEYWSELPCPPQGDLPTQGSNPSLPHCRQTLYHMSHQGSPAPARTEFCSERQCLFLTALSNFQAILCAGNFLNLPKSSNMCRQVPNHILPGLSPTTHLPPQQPLLKSPKLFCFLRA